MTSWKDTGDAVQAFVTAAGIVAGGVFTYFKFAKDRIYRPRVDLRIEVDRVDIDGPESFLLCRASVENKGANKLSLHHQGTALVFRKSEYGASELECTSWSPIQDSGVVDVFPRHDWIESGETIRDEVLLRIAPDTTSSYRVELSLMVAKPSPTRGGSTEITTGVILPSNYRTTTVPASNSGSSKTEERT